MKRRCHYTLKAVCTARKRNADHKTVCIREALIKSGAQMAPQSFRQIVQIERRWADAHQAKFVQYASLAQHATYLLSNDVNFCAKLEIASKMRAKPSGVI